MNISFTIRNGYFHTNGAKRDGQTKYVVLTPSLKQEQVRKSKQRAKDQLQQQKNKCHRKKKNCNILIQSDDFQDRTDLSKCGC